MKNIRSFCTTCGKTQEVLTITFDDDGACIYSLKCGHERYLKYAVRNDIVRAR